MSPDTNISPKIEHAPTQLIEVMKDFYQMFKNDPDLVKKGAMEHHIDVTFGWMLDKPKNGAYSARLPFGTPEEVEKIQNAHTLLIACMDYRQVGELYEEENPDIFIAMAGGAVQPKKERKDMLVKLLTKIHEMNPDIELILTYHNEVCGGANAFTNGEMKRIHDGPQGTQKEKQEMTGYMQSLVKDLIENGVSKDHIRLLISNVDPKTDRFSHRAAIDID